MKKNLPFLAALIFVLSLIAFIFSLPSFGIAAPQFQADNNIKVTSTIVANNTTAIVIKSSAGTVYSIDAFNNSTTLAYIKLYNSATATCGSGTPQARYLIPFGASSAGGGFNVSNINGDGYGQGIVLCVTTGIADTDTGAPAASTYIVNLHFK
jgi:hypothetical protein